MNEQYVVSPDKGVRVEVVVQPRIVAQLSRAAEVMCILITSGGSNDSGDAVSRGAISSLAPHETTTPPNLEITVAGVKPTLGSDATPGPGADASQAAPPGVNLAAMTHAWLFVGLPGSG